MAAQKLDFHPFRLYLRLAPHWRSNPESMKPTRKLHIKSYGCQMNVYDANRMADTLAPIGFVETAMAEQADLILSLIHI